MRSVLLYKSLNCAVNTTTDPDHTTNINYNTNYSIMILMVIYLLVPEPNF